VFSGEWRTASGGVVDVQEPATLERLSQTGLANAADVAAAARTAAQAQPLWAAMPYEVRADVFRKAARLVGEHADTLRSWLVRETGSIPPKADVELKMIAGILNQSAAMPGEPQGLMLPANN
jgi:benzaldehyde dehydrogenase (NAD)